MIKEVRKIQPDCAEARRTLVKHYLGDTVNEIDLKSARSHCDSCGVCLMTSINALKDIAFGAPVKMTCGECRKDLIEFVNNETKGNQSAENYNSLINHLAYCLNCHQEYMLLRKMAEAGEKLELVEAPKANLSFLPKKRKRERPIKISVRFLTDATIKIIEATGQVFTGTEWVPLTLKPALAMRAFPALSIDAEKTKRERSFAKMTVKVTDTIWATIKLAQDDTKCNDISIITFTLDKNEKPRPASGLLIALRGPSKMPGLPVKTSIQGLASFKKLPGNYILSIYDNKVKLREYKLILKSE